jgi:hypothetical protein
MNTGKEYELFVAALQQALLNAENITTQKNITVEQNKKIIDRCGIERQFDVYWEYELGGLTYKTVIECKDYNSYIPVEKIDALVGKTSDIPDLKAVFATKKGYQSGAKTKAEQHKIELLIVREQNDSDWTDEDGNPLIKSICVNIHAIMPAQILDFSPSVDGKWLKENSSIDISKFRQLNCPLNEIFIEDIIKNETYSLHELSLKLLPLDNMQNGVFENIEKFDNAYLRCKELKVKLVNYKIKYLISLPVSTKVEMDFSKELVGVIEYLQRDTKKSIFKNGLIK